MVQSMLKHGHFTSKIDRNFTFLLLMHGVAAVLGFYCPWHLYTCLCMSDDGVIWFDLTGLWPRRRGIFSFSVNTFSFHPQLSNELIDDSITNIITHSVCTNNIILIRAFPLVIEVQMCGRVIFCLAGLNFSRSNSAATNALGFHSLLSFSFTLYHLALESQPPVVLRTPMKN